MTVLDLLNDFSDTEQVYLNDWLKAADPRFAKRSNRSYWCPIKIAICEYLREYPEDNVLKDYDVETIKILIGL